MKPEVAKAQLEAEQPGAGPGPAGGPEPAPGGGAPLPGPGNGPEPPAPALPSRFYASVELNPDCLGRDAGRIAEEVLQHLTVLPGSKVRVTFEIDAEVPDGVSEDTQRVVTENCQTLKFKDHGFEAE